ncbi:MAG: cytochrome c oxidase subunit 3 [Ginsengibacter sp.]
MIAIMNDQKKRIHPHKFTLWVGIGSIVMMFAGLTSAYIVKRNLANWLSFDLSPVFYISTVVIIISSVTMLLAKQNFVKSEMQKYRIWLFITMILGIVFVVLQTVGFVNLWKEGITLTRNVAFSFLYIIVGLHALHIVAGVIALMVTYIRSLSVKRKNYSIVPVDLLSTYWHFVDLLWLYLLAFLMLIR